MKKNVLIALLIVSNAATGFVAYQQNKNAEAYARIAEESQKVAALHLEAANRAREEAYLQRKFSEQQQVLAQQNEQLALGSASNLKGKK